MFESESFVESTVNTSTPEFLEYTLLSLIMDMSILADGVSFKNPIY